MKATGKADSAESVEVRLNGFIDKFEPDVARRHCHIAVEKSDVGVVAAVTGKNDSGASWLSGS